ncbi:MAG: hypothetical protein NZM42_07780 [Gemmatales bacterium]|nr:hypothetical protein [Gemmatales bacterium]
MRKNSWWCGNFTKEAIVSHVVNAEPRWEKSYWGGYRVCGRALALALGICPVLVGIFLPTVGAQSGLPVGVPQSLGRAQTAQGGSAQAAPLPWSWSGPQGVARPSEWPWWSQTGQAPSVPQRPWFYPWAESFWRGNAWPMAEPTTVRSAPSGNFPSPYFMPGGMPPVPATTSVPSKATLSPQADGQISNAAQVAGSSVEGPDASATLSSLRRQHFDPMQVQLRQENGRWLLVSGDVVLKNFARHDTEAMFALQAIRFYRLNERWTLGEGDAAIEFWFSYGQAPRGRLPGQRTIPLQPERLQVQQVGEYFWVTDGKYRYFRFRRFHEAQQAVAIIQRFRFTQIGVIGLPQPIMVYFLAE